LNVVIIVRFAAQRLLRRTLHRSVRWSAIFERVSYK